MKNYFEEMTSEKLIAGLDWLSAEEIRPEALKDIEHVKFVHGQEDIVAPVTEAVEIADRLGHAKLICFEDTGHLPFLRKDFTKRLYDD